MLFVMLVLTAGVAAVLVGGYSTNDIIHEPDVREDGSLAERVALFNTETSRPDYAASSWIFEYRHAAGSVFKDGDAGGFVAVRIEHPERYAELTSEHLIPLQQSDGTDIPWQSGDYLYTGEFVTRTGLIKLVSKGPGASAAHNSKFIPIEAFGLTSKSTIYDNGVSTIYGN